MHTREPNSSKLVTWPCPIGLASAVTAKWVQSHLGPTGSVTECQTRHGSPGWAEPLADLETEPRRVGPTSQSDSWIVLVVAWPPSPAHRAFRAPPRLRHAPRHFIEHLAGAAGDRRRDAMGGSRSAPDRPPSLHPLHPHTHGGPAPPAPASSSSSGSRGSRALALPIRRVPFDSDDRKLLGLGLSGGCCCLGAPDFISLFACLFLGVGTEAACAPINHVFNC